MWARARRCSQVAWLQICKLNFEDCARNLRVVPWADGALVGGVVMMGWRAPFPRARPKLLRSVLLGLAAAVAATAIRWTLVSFLGQNFPFITYFPLLLAASIWGGLRGGLIALVLSAAMAGQLFMRPDEPLRLWALGAFVVSGGVITLAGALLAEAVRIARDRERQLLAREAELRILVGELAHRGQNAITVLMAIVSQSLRNAGSLRDAEQTINARLDALRRAQGEVLKAHGGPTPLRALLLRTLEPFDLTRFEIRHAGCPKVKPEAATALCLVVHELATNAVKYGALSGPGRVYIESKDAAGAMYVRWTERGGPRVTPPDSGLRKPPVEQGAGVSRRPCAPPFRARRRRMRNRVARHTRNDDHVPRGGFAGARLSPVCPSARTKEPENGSTTTTKPTI